MKWTYNLYTSKASSRDEISDKVLRHSERLREVAWNEFSSKWKLSIHCHLHHPHHICRLKSFSFNTIRQSKLLCLVYQFAIHYTLHYIIYTIHYRQLNIVLNIITLSFLSVNYRHQWAIGFLHPVDARLPWIGIPSVCSGSFKIQCLLDYLKSLPYEVDHWHSKERKESVGVHKCSKHWQKYNSCQWFFLFFKLSFSQANINDLTD